MVNRRRVPTSPIERANQEADETFVANYLRQTGNEASPWITSWAHPRTDQRYGVRLLKADGLTDEEITACFELIIETSHHDYEGSSIGWHPTKKRKEMRSPDLRYILVKNEAGSLRGFASFMPTWEEGQPVVYCYEIHLKPELQRTGLGKLLMNCQFTIARNIPSIGKVMLTCFLSNSKGLAFYKHLGFAKDEISPSPRELRGKVINPDYVILSKTVAGNERP